MRHNYSLDVIMPIVLANPQALDRKDKMGKTPRDILEGRLEGNFDYEILTSASKSKSIDEVVEVSLNDHGDDEVQINHSKQICEKYKPDMKALLQCPASCLVEHSESTDIQNNVDKKISDMEEEINLLEDELVDIYEEQAYIDGTLDGLTKSVEEFLVVSMESVQLNERMEILDMTIGPELDKINTSLENAVKLWDKSQYHLMEEDRKYITAFNEDVKIFYEKIHSDMASIKDEMKSLESTMHEHSVDDD